MIIEPKIIGGVCLTAHPAGCRKAVNKQITYVKSQNPITMPKRVLIIGGSTGYGLATRIVAAFAGGADTLSISFEREPSERKPASPGWYNTKYFDSAAAEEGLKAVSINADAFSHETRETVIRRIKELFGQVDLVVYSLASPARKDPDTGETHKSVLKPLGEDYRAKAVDFMKGVVGETVIESAGENEAESTAKVMGGEDWTLWIQALLKGGVLAKNIRTVAYSYIGPQVTHAIYRSGTIGKAKEHLEASAAAIQALLSPLEGEAFVSVNKAVVTRASSVIPVVPLYMALLFKIMKIKNLHEGCIEQMYRMLAAKIYGPGGVLRDEGGMVRMDDWEMREDVQAEISSQWNTVTTKNLDELTDIAGFRREFLQLHGFDWPGVDYDREVSPLG